MGCDVLLVVPPSRTHYRVPPLGLGYLGAALRRRGFRVLIHDCVNEGIGSGEIAASVRRHRAPLVGIQVFSRDVESAREVARVVLREAPGTVIVAGGAHPSAAPRETLAEMVDVAYAFQGEGEIGFPELAARLGRGRPIETEGIPGLVWREDGGVRRNEIEPIRDLDAVSPPAWDLMDPRHYRSAPQGVFFRFLPIAPISTSRGCPHPCTFCAGFTLMGKPIRRRSLASVLAEVDLLTQTYGVRELHIVDDTFTQFPDRVREFCEALIERDRGLAFTFPNGIRLDTVDRPLLELLKRAGCYSVILGIESGSQRVLDDMKKGTSLDLIRRQVALVAEVGIRAMGFFILGYPTETREDALATIRFAKSLSLEGAHFGHFLPLPGTEATARLMAEGRLGEVRWSDLAYTRPVCPPPGMTAAELKRLVRRAYLGFYLRPRLLLGLVRQVRSFAHLRRIMERIWDYAFAG